MRETLDLDCSVQPILAWQLVQGQFAHRDMTAKLGVYPASCMQAGVIEAVCLVEKTPHWLAHQSSDYCTLVLDDDGFQSVW